MIIKKDIIELIRIRTATILLAQTPEQMDKAVNHIAELNRLLQSWEWE